MKKRKVVALLLCMSLVLCMSTVGLAAGPFTVSQGITEARIPLTLPSTGGDFAGFQITITHTPGTSFNTFELSSEFARSMPIEVERGEKTFVGAMTSGNGFSPAANGNVFLGYLIMNYTGDTSENVVISDIKIVRVLDKDHVSEEFFDENSIAIVRGGPDSGTPDDPSVSQPPTVTGDPGPGGPGGPGGPAAPGGPADPAQPTTTAAPGQDVDDPALPGAEGEVVYAPFINGYPDGTVKPGGSLTRAELAQLIYNLYGNGAINASNYTDVAATHWASNPIGFCQESGYLIGYPDGTFAPDRTVTRAELATAFVRIKEIDPVSEHPFTDVGEHWAVQFIGASYTAELIVGDPGGTFRPDDFVTRAEAVTIICRAEGRNQTLFDTDRTFTDLDSAFWGYDYVMNAANGYNYEAPAA